MPLKPIVLSEEEIIDGCRKNNPAAQKALFHRYGPVMLTVCRRFARHQMEAEDFLQEGFIRVFKYFYQFQGQSSLASWIRRIMINNALKHISKSAFKNEQIGIDHEFDAPFEDGIYAKLSAEDIIRLIQDLPNGYRIVFNLYAIEGYSHKEIADMLNIGESTSRSQLLKARRILQEKFNDLQKMAV